MFGAPSTSLTQVLTQCGSGLARNQSASQIAREIVISLHAAYPSESGSSIRSLIQRSGFESLLEFSYSFVDLVSESVLASPQVSSSWCWSPSPVL
jgi:hypothetical protein